MIQEIRKPEDYADIIDYEYHGTTTHAPMPMEKRAAQFSPFAALSGMEEKYDEEMRYTDEQIELTKEKIEEINRNIRQLSECISGKRTADAIMTWFIPDLTKDGGMYRTDRVSVKKIDDVHHVIVLSNSSKVPVADIMDIILVGEKE